MGKVVVDVYLEGTMHEAIEVEDYALNSVLFDFNPSADPNVTTIKAISAALITKMHRIIHDVHTNPQQRRNAAIAITEMEAVQMRAVKALFAK